MVTNFRRINSLGFIECSLCNTLHRSEENYQIHMEGKRHQRNITKVKKKFTAPNEQKQPNMVYTNETCVKEYRSAVFVISQDIYKIAVQIEFLYEIDSEPKIKILNSLQFEENVEDIYLLLVVFYGDYKPCAVKVPRCKIYENTITKLWDEKTKKLIFTVECSK